MKIALITTGGTIGSVEKNGVRALGKAGPDNIAAVCPDAPDGIEFLRFSPVNILSENMTLSDISLIIGSVREALGAGCSGVLITHGSDCLAYTANILGAVFGDIGIPTVITASFSAGDSEESAENIRSSLELILSGEEGCYVLFKNPGDSEPTVFFADDIIQCEPSDNRFRAFKTPAGTLRSGRLIRADGFRKRRFGLRNADTGFKKRVLIIKGYPGLDYDSVTPGPDTAAVLHTVYHSYTANALEQASGFSLLSFKKRLDMRGIPLFIAPFDADAPVYESTALLLKNGVKAIGGLSPEAAYARLLLWVNSSTEDFFDFNKLFI